MVVDEDAGKVLQQPEGRGRVVFNARHLREDFILTHARQRINYSKTWSRILISTDTRSGLRPRIASPDGQMMVLIQELEPQSRNLLLIHRSGRNRREIQRQLPSLALELPQIHPPMPTPRGTDQTVRNRRSHLSHDRHGEDAGLIHDRAHGLL